MSAHVRHGRHLRRVAIAAAVGALVVTTGGLAIASSRGGAVRETPGTGRAGLGPLRHGHRPPSAARRSPAPSGTASPQASGAAVADPPRVSESVSVPAGAAVDPPSSTPSGSSPVSAPAAPASGSAGSWWHPAVGTSWQWQLSGTLDLSYSVGVYDVDLFDTSAAQVEAIHAKGARAICYLETGAWEDYRPDAGRYPSSVLGKPVGGYPAERYVDLRQLAVLRPIIAARLDLCAQKGFDGVEPDIDDSVPDVGAAAIGFPVSYADQLAFNRMVAEDAHARGLAIGLKNGTFGDDPAAFVADMQPLVDFAVNEECAADGVCGVLSVLTAHGKPVFHTEYLNDYAAGASAKGSASATSAAAQILAKFCPVTQGLRFSSILKDASASLSAWRAACPS